MRSPSRLLLTLLALSMSAISHPAAADTAGPFTSSLANLTTGTAPLQPAYSTFSLPRFDASLGSLQRVDLTFDLSGTVVGSATGVNRSSSIDGTISHHVFFRFEDISDNVFIAEPRVQVNRTIPAGAQNATILFGPEFQSTSLAFSVTAGDGRFDAFGSGSGDISGRLGVFFSNTTFGFNDTLVFFQGADSGTYGGSFSVAYDYVPVPEPGSLLLSAVGALLLALPLAWKRRRLSGGG